MTDHTAMAPAPSLMLPTTSGTPPPSVWRETLDLIRTTGAALLVAVAIQTVLFQPFTIPSSSMEPGLVTGDYIVVSKFSYGWSRASLAFNPPVFRGRLFGRQAQHGDVVVFRLPRDPQQTWIKRVIGLPGDRVQVTSGVVFVNGRALPQAAAGLTQDHDAQGREVLQVRETQPNGRTYVTYDGGSGGIGDDTGVYVVPEGFYFMMGDNRDNSLDSRWPRELGVGLLPAENVVGKAEVVVASWKPGAGLFKPWTWLNLQPGRFLRPIR
ncbi:signal peptidase I [soil metagenome]